MQTRAPESSASTQYSAPSVLLCIINRLLAHRERNKLFRGAGLFAKDIYFGVVAFENTLESVHRRHAHKLKAVYGVTNSMRLSYISKRNSIKSPQRSFAYQFGPVTRCNSISSRSSEKPHGPHVEYYSYISRVTHSSFNCTPLSIVNTNVASARARLQTLNGGFECKSIAAKPTNIAHHFSTTIARMHSAEHRFVHVLAQSVQHAAHTLHMFDSYSALDRS